jgi:hypothetical protein
MLTRARPLVVLYQCSFNIHVCRAKLNVKGDCMFVGHKEVRLIKESKETCCGLMVFTCLYQSIRAMA